MMAEQAFSEITKRQNLVRLTKDKKFSRAMFRQCPEETQHVGKKKVEALKVNTCL